MVRFSLWSWIGVGSVVALLLLPPQHAVAADFGPWVKVDVGADGDASNDDVLPRAREIADSWDAWSYYPAVIKDGAGYKMWYTGTTPRKPTYIGLATSPDGTTWTRHDVGADGDHTNDHLLAGYAASVIKDNGIYKMWFGWNKEIHYAESLDGVAWMSQGRVLAKGPSGAWDEEDCSWASVVKDGGLYRMWYGGTSAALQHTYRIGYATSADGQHWTKLDSGSAGFVLAPSAPWCDGGVNDPTVLHLDGQWHMWFHGSQRGRLRIGHAVSADGVAWTQDPTWVLEGGAPGAWDQEHAWSPCVVADGDVLRMWYTGWPAGGAGRQTGGAVSRRR